jgi:hypothetical protein
VFVLTCTVVVLTCFVRCVCVGVLVMFMFVFAVFVLLVLCFCVVSSMYIYSNLFCVYWCRDYCHRVSTQLQLIIIMIIIIIGEILNQTYVYSDVIHVTIVH